MVSEAVLFELFSLFTATGKVVFIPVFKIFFFCLLFSEVCILVSDISWHGVCSVRGLLSFPKQMCRFLYLLQNLETYIITLTAFWIIFQPHTFSPPIPVLWWHKQIVCYRHIGLYKRLCPFSFLLFFSLVFLCCSCWWFLLFHLRFTEPLPCSLHPTVELIHWNLKFQWKEVRLPTWPLLRRRRVGSLLFLSIVFGWNRAIAV